MGAHALSGEGVSAEDDVDQGRERERIDGHDDHDDDAKGMTMRGTPRHALRSRSQAQTRPASTARATKQRRGRGYRQKQRQMRRRLASTRRQVNSGNRLGQNNGRPCSVIRQISADFSNAPTARSSDGQGPRDETDARSEDDVGNGTATTTSDRTRRAS
ncbi:hypothetical protein RJ55_02108 [Drechmeria coniospora]|nr:hypothetical protein RJ55_02108 [Drechmeria coniospora]